MEKQTTNKPIIPLGKIEINNILVKDLLGLNKTYGPGHLKSEQGCVFWELEREGF